MYISESVRYRAILKNRFPATFGSHLEFLLNMQKRAYLGNGARFVYVEDTSDFLQKFPATFGAILNFYVRHKKVYI